MKVLVSDLIAEDGIKKLEEEGLEVVIKPGLSPDELKLEIKDADAIIVRSATKVKRDIIEAAEKLKVIGRAGVGLDNVDQEAAKERGIKVVNTPGATSISVAELALAHMLALSRHIVEGTVSLREGRWEKKKLEGVELYGKILRVVGCGRIGRELAKRAQAMGMETIGSDIEGLCDMAAIKDADIEMVPLNELLEKSDYITLHMPLTKENKHLFGEEVFEKMKPTAILINCARGGIVDEEALYEALKEGRIKGAAMDVFEVEPPQDYKLATLKNFIGTPHIGAATEEGQLRAGVEIAELVAGSLKALKSA